MEDKKGKEEIVKSKRLETKSEKKKKYIYNKQRKQKGKIKR